MSPSGQLAPPADRLRLAPGHELERALDLVRHLSDAVLAMGARRQVSLVNVAGVRGIRLEQQGGYYLVPVQRLARQPVGGDEFLVNAWRCDRVVRTPLGDEDESDVAAGRVELLPYFSCDTIEALSAWVMGDVQRQWIAEALDDFMLDEFSRIKS